MANDSGLIVISRAIKRSTWRLSPREETIGYAGGKLSAGVADDLVTCRSFNQQSVD